MSSLLMSADHERSQGNDKLKAGDLAGAREHFAAAQRQVDLVDPEKDGCSASEVYGLEEGKKERTEELAQDMKRIEAMEAAAPK